MRIEIRSLRTVSIIIRLHRQYYRGTKVSKANNVKRRITDIV